MGTLTQKFEALSNELFYVLDNESVGDGDPLQSITQLQNISNHLNYVSSKQYEIGNVVYSLGKYYQTLVVSTGVEPSTDPVKFSEILVAGSGGSTIEFKEGIVFDSGTIINKTSGIDSVVFNSDSYTINFLSGTFKDTNYIVTGLNLIHDTETKPFIKITGKTLTSLTVKTTQINIDTKMSNTITFMEVN